MRTTHPDRKWHALLICFGLVPLLACAAAETRDLNAARAELARAERGPARQYAPAELAKARYALDRAEQAFDTDMYDPGAPAVATEALNAVRFASARSDLVQAEQARRAAILAQQQSDQRHEVVATQSELNKTQEQLRSEQAARLAEQMARVEAEKKAREAEEKLGKLAEVRHDERGTVVTLSGSVLFASGKSQLLPSARLRLSEVAEALTGTNNHIVIEGYTDSRGSSKKNRVLAEERATAVRSYLVSRGVDADQVSAVGLGPVNPVADNRTPEGRANNRRVEIIIQATQPAGPGTPTTPGVEKSKGDADDKAAKPATGKKHKGKKGSWN